jgi:S1-C subfamily serine protease
VVADAQRFQVTLASGRHGSASLVGLWAHCGTGFADPSELDVGDIVMAIGNPLGVARASPRGIVNSLGSAVSDGGAAW